jgi:hypothetical protein
MHDRYAYLPDTCYFIHLMVELPNDTIISRGNLAYELALTFSYQVLRVRAYLD